MRRSTTWTWWGLLALMFVLCEIGKRIEKPYGWIPIAAAAVILAVTGVQLVRDWRELLALTKGNR